ncbi:acetylglutamate kinase [Cellulosilyticum sp. ST5]|uniref:Acetylglutamate kinase n=1 Tax=Cellulosilyticum lentocellum (strain ATCC 49066 / DSM 5427 / NCIMB 11756 / RHM5) TaxID=642492 RepID=F2JI90_CELLD|nr:MULTISPECIES: acetylglutamate kinase [Cellulosilyticum]ADZ83118.1 acetylglutamate kinase [Cellulosilyticum lentocellum DSM 5427]QEH68602.1 acetylglutamate kinase [Cellulosilyticum sp. WCF-2]
MNDGLEKAKVLIDALPYIREFNGNTVVIKYGGSAMLDPEINKTIVQDIVLLKLVGLKPVIVHGGGPEINNMLKRLDIQSEFINGLRVTTKETMEVVEMVLAGKVNKQIVEMISGQGGCPVGLTGKDGKILRAKKLNKDGVDLGFVGEIEKVNTRLIKSLIDNDFIPIIAPIGSDEEGNTYNINADYAAVAIAGALNAQKLVFLTDVEGVLKDKDDPKSLISFLSDSEAKKYIESGIIAGGMIPKVECCMEAIEEGVSMVHILDGRKKHALILEIYTPNGIGTMMYKKEA